MSGTPGFELRLLDTAAGPVPCVLRGPRDGPQLVVIQPLFEEMNRCRRLLAGVTRRLAASGIGSWLFDLPGTGDSPLRTEAARWADWRATAAAMTALANAGGASVHLLSVRAGALLDGGGNAADSIYRLAPVARGERVLREMLRVRVAAEAERGTPTTVAALEAELAAGTALELAGYRIGTALAADLRSAEAAPASVPCRVAALADGAADLTLDGPPVWRQAEPQAADALADILASDIERWIAACGRR